jgi:hypothetical protein
MPSSCVLAGKKMYLEGWRPERKFRRKDHSSFEEAALAEDKA